MPLVKASQKDVHPQMLDEVASNLECDACIGFEVKNSSPIVKMPRDPMVNREIAADVFYYKGEPILPVMCTFTADCQAVLIVGVTGVGVVRCLVDCWIHYVGRPELLLCDFDPEFANGEVRGLCETYGFEKKRAAGQAHWSGG